MKVGSLVKYTQAKLGMIKLLPKARTDIGLVVEAELARSYWTAHLVKVKWRRPNVPSPVWERSLDLEIINE